VWSLTRRLARPSCGPPPAGSDGFVPLDDLARPKHKKWSIRDFHG
jgi:hypothetical protein